MLSNVTDSVPTVTLHNKVTFGNSKRMPDVSIAYTDETPAGLKLTNGAISRSDVIGASISPMIQSKSGITIDPGMTFILHHLRLEAKLILLIYNLQLAERYM